MLTIEQLAERKTYIGGSDAAAALGLSRWKTPLTLWAEKTGQLEPEDISGKLPVKLGNKMEQIVVDLFEEETGKKCHRVNETKFHPSHPFLGANIDRRVVGENAILEAKTASAWKAKEWEGEEFPIEYLIQVNHYLLVTGAEYAYIAVLIGNQSFVWKRIDRDEALLADMEKRLVEFWKYVKDNIRPSVVRAGDNETLYRLFPVEDKGKIVRLGDELDRIVEQRSALLQDKASISKQIDAMDAMIKAQIGENEMALTSKYRVSWKAYSQKEYIVPARSGRKLNIRGIENGNE